MTITQSGQNYVVDGIEEISGEYEIDDEGYLHAVDGRSGNMWINHDVVTVTMESAFNARTIGFDRNGSEQARVTLEQITTFSQYSFIGQWKCRYNFYSTYMNVTLELTSRGGDSVNWHTCTWKQQTDQGVEKREYHWLAYYSEDNNQLVGPVDAFDRKNVSVIITPQDGDSILIASIMPPNEQGWDRTFRRK